MSVFAKKHPGPMFFIISIASSIDAYLTVAKSFGIPSFIDCP